MKKCSKCHHSKPIDDFYADHRSSDGKRSDCKDCNRKVSAGWFASEKNKEKERNRVKKRMAAKRKAAISALGGVCCRCGIDDYRVLQIDHINRGGAEERKKKGPYAIYNSIIKGADHYQLFCANCHAIKSHEEGDYVYASGPAKA